MYECITSNSNDNEIKFNELQGKMFKNIHIDINKYKNIDIFVALNK